MATPEITARTTPSGYKLPEGFKITIAFSLKPALNIWEVEGAPAGVEVAEINTTTQHNVRWVSKNPSALIASDDIVGTAGYDPDVMDDLIGMIGQTVTGNGATASCVTIHMPDGTTHNYFAFLKSFKFGALRVGQFPTGSYAICVTNFDPIARVEQGCYTVQAGTT